MTEQNNNPGASPWVAIETADGSWTLAHREHSEWYHSADGAVSEAQSLYIDSSGILNRLQAASPVRVLDVGLGLGYNALATVAAWQRCGGAGKLEILSLENDADLFAYLRSGKAPWQKGWPAAWLAMAESLELAQDGIWQAWQRGADGGELLWRVALGDAKAPSSFAALANMGPYDFVWQDPFSPAKNPSMWGFDWFSALVGSVKRDGVLMTYSVARPVREALSDAGWRVEKIPTTTRKKNWLRAFRLARAGDPT
ncbi:MAG: hypothetical protein RIQ81_1219 [Pseudomonadota bacterium]|jgi:tRNA 5-methylaminomethyl-2-thiouridine biosynthesis bifunctional protein